MANHQPGLPSLNEARAQRRRQIVTGKAKIAGFPPQFVLWSIVILGALGILYYRKSLSDLERARNTLMSKQRAVAHALGPKLLPIRDKVEAAAKELGGPVQPDYVAEGVEWDKLAETPGVYLRLRIEDSRDVEKIRKAATDSLRDGFTSCMFRDPKAPPPSQGKTCRISADCEPGELCTEFSVCQRPVQPFNMRLVYRALHVLSNKWTDEVHQAKNELAIDAYSGGLDSVTRVDIPAAIEVFQRAKIATIVLDEAPKGGLPAAVAGVEESDAERLQRGEHMARIGIWDLQSGKQLLRMRTEASGELREVGGRTVQDPVTIAARQRQANSCSLALAARGKINAAAPAIAEGATPEDAKAPQGAVPPSGASPQGAAPEASAPAKN
jgi:hypothetical protein